MGFESFFDRHSAVPPPVVVSGYCQPFIRRTAYTRVELTRILEIVKTGS